MAQVKRKKANDKKPGLKVVEGGKGKGKKSTKVEVEDRTQNSEWMRLAGEEVTQLEARVKEANEKAGSAFYEIGTAVLAAHSHECWRATGAKSFEEWVTSRLPITVQSAYNMMSVAKNLSQEQATKLGATCSYIIARATSKEAMEELLSLANRGTTAAELRRREKLQRERDGVEVTPGGKPGKQGGGRRIEKVNKKVTAQKKAEAQPEPKVKVPQKVSDEPKPGTLMAVVPGDSGVVELKSVNPKKESERFKAGYTKRSRFQLGENGPRIQIDVNFEKGLLKYRVFEG